MINLQTGDTQALIKASKDAGLLRNQTAYVLATVYHETGATMKPITEKGGPKYLHSKPYWPQIGRGYVQLTWARNYIYWGKRLNADFMKHPELLLTPEYAVPIAVQGMKEGKFTGVGLAHYITLAKSDFLHARKIVNLMDQAELIAGYAVQYDKLLKAVWE